jgi:3-oxoacyl-ACP reductase-like protein
MEENGTAPATTGAETVEAPKAEETVEATAAAEPVAEAPAETPAEPAAEPEEISYHAVEKEGHVAAIWEMQGRKHLRTIDPRSSEGKQIMDLYTAETHE